MDFPLELLLIFFPSDVAVAFPFLGAPHLLLSQVQRTEQWLRKTKIKGLKTAIQTEIGQEFLSLYILLRQTPAGFI